MLVTVATALKNISFPDSFDTSESWFFFNFKGIKLTSGGSLFSSSVQLDIWFLKFHLLLTFVL